SFPNRRISFGHHTIVVFRDGAKLRTEGKGCCLTNVFHRFRIHSAAGRQWIANLDDTLCIRYDVSERLTAEIAGAPISHPIPSLKSHSLLWGHAILIVAEPQERRPVALNLQNADALGIVVGQQVFEHGPVLTLIVPNLNLCKGGRYPGGRSHERRS